MTKKYIILIGVLCSQFLLGSKSNSFDSKKTKDLIIEIKNYLNQDRPQIQMAQKMLFNIGILFSDESRRSDLIEYIKQNNSVQISEETSDSDWL